MALGDMVVITVSVLRTGRCGALLLCRARFLAYNNRTKKVGPPQADFAMVNR